MKRREIVLSAMAPANGESHSPVQVQKLLFLLDREAAELVGGPYFKFVPYNYGPFDKTVYEELEQLDAEGMVKISQIGWTRSYALTPTGQQQGDGFLGNLPEQAQEYIRGASEFVKSLSFMQLVSAIYRTYPDMRENSVLRPPS